MTPLVFKDENEANTEFAIWRHFAISIILHSNEIDEAAPSWFQEITEVDVGW